MGCTLRLIAPNGPVEQIRPAPYSAESLADAALSEQPGGVYAAFATWYGRRVVRLAAHLERLRDSASRVGIALDLDTHLVRRQICAVMDEAGLAEAKIRLSLHPDSDREGASPTLTLGLEKYHGPPIEEKKSGVACRVRAGSARGNPQAKQTGWLKERHQFAEPGVYEWLLSDAEGRVLEGASSNFYGVRTTTAGSTLVTAGEGILTGTARAIVLEVCPPELPVVLEAPRTADLDTLSEAFLSSATRGIVPVVTIDGHPVGSGRPGPVTVALMRAWDTRARALAEPLCPAATEDSIDRFIRIPEIRTTLGDLGVFVHNFATGETTANSLWYDYGYGAERLTGRFLLRIVHPDDAERVVHALRSLSSGDETECRVTCRVRSRDEEWHSVIGSGRVVARGRDGGPEILIGSVVDVTEQERDRRALVAARAEAEAQAQEAEALRMAGAIVASTLEVERTVRLVLDQALNVVPYDTATVQLLRDDALEVIGGNGWSDISAIIGLRIPYPADNPHSRAIRTQSPTLYADIGTEFPQYANIGGTVIRSWLGIPLIVHGEVIGLLALDSLRVGFFTPKHIRLATALGDHVAVALHNARLYEQAQELAMTDSLTGISTRRSFFALAETALRTAIATDSEISVVMADLDHFKEINDEFGHAIGDEAIRRVVGAAQEILRRTDLIGRYGGDELVVVLPQTGAESALAIAERLRARVEATIVPGMARTLTVSLGVRVCRPRPGDSIDAILDHADQALLEAKRLGRNRVVRGE